MHWAHVHMCVIFFVGFRKVRTYMFSFSGFVSLCWEIVAVSITIVLYYEDSYIFSRIFSKYLPQIIAYLLPVLSPHFLQLSIMRADYFQSQVLPISHKSQFSPHFTNLIQLSVLYTVKNYKFK